MLRIRSLRMQMIVWFTTICALLIVILAASNTMQLQAYARQAGMSTLRGYASQVLNSLDIYLYDAESMARSVMADEAVQAALHTELEKQDMPALLTLRRLQTILAGYVASRTQVARVMLVNSDGLFLDPLLLDASESMTQQLWYRRMADTALDTGYSMLHQQAYLSSGSDVFTLSKTIYSVAYPRIVLGHLLMDMNRSLLTKTVPGALPFPDAYLVLLNPSGDVMFQCGNELLADALPAGTLPAQEDGSLSADGTAMVCRTESTLSAWQAVVLVPITTFNGLADGAVTSTILLTLVVVAGIALAAHFIVRHAFKPVLAVIDGMDQVSHGQLAVHLPPYDQRETKALTEGFNAMVVHIRDLLDQVRREEEMKRDAEVYALRAQVSPHFLYNTLNCVRYLARAGRSDEIPAVIGDIVGLLRACYQRDRYIALDKELSLIDQYLDIQRLRYDIEIRYDVSVPGELRCCAIPGFTVQPLVENALFHGIVPNAGGIIAIKAEKCGGDVIIRVTDDGIGMEPAMLRQVICDMRQPIGDHHEEGGVTHIGLANVDSRIKYFYDETYGMTIESCEGKGTEVTLRIPFRPMVLREDNDAKRVDR